MTLPRLKAANNALTTLSANLTSTDVSLTVASAAVFPVAPFRIEIDAEIIEVGAINVGTNTLSSLLRAQEGTVAAAHTSGATVENRWTSGMYGELESGLAQNTAPTSPYVGMWWTDTSLTPAVKKYWNGSAWQLSNGSSGADAREVLLTTTATTAVRSLTPTTNGEFLVAVSFRIITAATNVTITITWTDASGAVQTDTRLSNQSVGVGPHDVPIKYIDATTAGPITVNVTAGTANQVYATASILGV